MLKISNSNNFGGGRDFLSLYKELINNTLVRFISIFIISSKLRRKFRCKFLYLHEMCSNGNKVFLIDENGQVKQIANPVNGVRISFKGCNNQVFLNKNIEFKNSRLIFTGNNAKASLGSGYYDNFNAILAENGNLAIGNNFKCFGVTLHLREFGSTIFIGNNCLFSLKINIWGSDIHSLIIRGENKAYNLTKPIFIGDNVWLGYHSVVTKGAIISNNSAVGTMAVVSGKFTEPNIVLAGNPARIVKRGIMWSELSPYEYNQLFCDD